MIFRTRYFKSLIILSLLLLQITTGNITAQGRLGNKLEDNSIVSVSSLSGDLYQGIDNYLKVEDILKKGYDTLLFESNNGILTSDSNDYIVLIPERPGRIRLTMFGVTQKDTALIGYKYFNVNNVPQPKLTINDKPIETPCTLSKSSLLHCDSLGIYISDDIIGSETWYKILKFSLGYNYGGFYISHLNASNIITSETKDIIALLGPDRLISICPSAITQGNIIKELMIYRITVY